MTDNRDFIDPFLTYNVPNLVCFYLLQTSEDLDNGEMECTIRCSVIMVDRLGRLSKPVSRKCTI